MNTDFSEIKYNLREAVDVLKLPRLNYELLQEIHDGKNISENKILMDSLPNVKHILQIEEKYMPYSQFMETLDWRRNSLQMPSNAMRNVFNEFKSGTPQKWKLINAKEYSDVIAGKTISDDERAKKIFLWVDMAKFNIQQLVANSYMVSGPYIDAGKSKIDNVSTLHLLWYYLSGDEKIPNHRHNNSVNEKYFNDNYWNPFVEYIKTDFSSKGRAYETDASFNLIFDFLAEFELYKTEADKNLVTINKLIDIVHGRGSFSYIFLDS